jgi:hypothetical protein
VRASGIQFTKQSQAGCLCRDASVANHRSESGCAGARLALVSPCESKKPIAAERWYLASEVNHADGHRRGRERQFLSSDVVVVAQRAIKDQGVLVRSVILTPPGFVCRCGLYIFAPFCQNGEKP